MDSITIQDVIVALSILHDLFDIIRVVDPVNNQVIHCVNVYENQNESRCYDFWETEKPYANCASIRASYKNDTFMKIESTDYRKYLITASFVKLEGKEYIVETIKDISETGILTDLNMVNIKETREIISYLNEKILRDELTGAYNRRYVNERLLVNIFNAMVTNTNLSVIMLDIDHFKEINDTFGHIAGDKVLIELCRTIESKIRKGHDWVARYGGDEFLLVLTDANQSVAYNVSEKIRNAWRKKVMKHGNNLLRSTVSIGSYTVAPDKSFSEVMVAVDLNLYEAKRRGRNRAIAT